MNQKRLNLLMVFTFAFALVPTALAAEEAIDFDRDVRPILSNHCFQCHGPDEGNRKAKLRLDVRESAFAARDGEATIVAGKPMESLAYQRIISSDPDEIMPPVKANKKLSKAQIQTLKKWIDQGATWEPHWSLVVPKKQQLPGAAAVQGKPWARNAIDHFVLDGLMQQKLTPSPEADRRTLIRRLSFDLTGLRPTWEQTQAFVNDKSADAYEKVVDQLLASPHFGERMAMVWLDAARYSDTDGFQQDVTRTNWPWRDWVVQSFNENKRYDQFTIEQFAGDLLPQAKPEQILGTTFFRNHMTNGEGGRDPEESRIDYVMDRVETLGTLWLGLTLGCTQCHSHKYDPITHAEYYQLFAFFNSIDENGQAGTGAKPYIKVDSPVNASLLATANAESQRRNAQLDKITKEAEPAFVAWLGEQHKRINQAQSHASWSVIHPGVLRTTGGAILTQQQDGSIIATGPDSRHEDYILHLRSPMKRITGLKIEILREDALKGAKLARSEDGHFIATGLKVSARSMDGSQDRPVNIESAVASFSADKKAAGGYGPVAGLLDDDPRSGWASHGIKDDQQSLTAVIAFAEDVHLAEDEELRVEILHRPLKGHQSIGRFRLSLTNEAGPITKLVTASPLEQLAQIKVDDLTKLPAKLRSDLRAQYLADDAAYQEAKVLLDRVNSRVAEIRSAASVNVMVLKERDKPRVTNLLLRGEWDKKGEVVEPGTPVSLSPWPGDAERDRLGLAKWIVDKQNPLAARVAVNLFWQTIFGSGLVRTPEDFGAQGDRPTHPALLDHLAVQLVESDWNLRSLIKQFVMSATYRQSSVASSDLLLLDPDNRLLARANRFRLPSWMLRDAALRHSGLLNQAMGGPPVKPYHPDGVWEDITMGRFKYDATVGPDQYRRTLYAFWRRTAAPVFLFDNAQRRVCEVRVLRTNTPLHALTLMNDLTYLESSRALAAASLTDSNVKTHEDRINWIVQRVLQRDATALERATFSKLYDQAIAYYRDHPADAAKSLEGGQWQVDVKLKKQLPQLASYALVASAVMNLDEAISRE